MRIGFTVGVFDLLHHGHNNLLTTAQEHCDLLLVGVMNDYWVRVQKGHDRPAQSEQTRLLAVRNHSGVWKAILLDTLDMSPYLQVADVWLLGENQRNMRPFDPPIPQVRIPETPGVSTTLLLSGGYNAAHEAKTEVGRASDAGSAGPDRVRHLGQSEGAGRGEGRAREPA